MLVIGILGGGVAAMLLFLIGLNRFARPVKAPQMSGALSAGDPVGDVLRVVTWNIGFAGLDQSASLTIEGTQVWRPKSAALVAENTQGIGAQLAAMNGDITLLQETAQAGVLTRNIDVLGKLLAQLSPKWSAFWPDLRLRMPFAALSIIHGMSVISNRRASDVRVLKLPQSNTRFFMGLLRKYYGGLITRLPTSEGPDWVLINLHLSAFADAVGNRRDQMTQLFEFGEKEARAGHHVVIGGDWNMSLPSDASDLATTKGYEFPEAALPEGWSIYADGKTPSVRDTSLAFGDKTGHLLIDGFAVSPSVECRALKTHDLGFAFSDHNPVEAVFALRKGADTNLGMLKADV